MRIKLETVGPKRSLANGSLIVSLLSSENMLAYTATRATPVLHHQGTFFLKESKPFVKCKRYVHIYLTHFDRIADLAVHLSINHPS